MKTLIFSDLHGNVDNLKLLLSKATPEVSEIWCLGDIFFDYKNDAQTLTKAEEIMDILENYEDKPILYFKGNCDDREEYKRFSGRFIKESFVIKELSGYKFLITHGHMFENKEKLKNILDGNLVHGIIYGHSHIFSLEVQDGYFYINPGSPSIPRDTDTICTYMLFDNEKRSFLLKELHTQDTLEELILANF